MRQSLPYFPQLVVSKTLTTDSLRVSQQCSCSSPARQFSLTATSLERPKLSHGLHCVIGIGHATLFILLIHHVASEFQLSPGSIAPRSTGHFIDQLFGAGDGDSAASHRRKTCRHRRGHLSGQRQSEQRCGDQYGVQGNRADHVLLLRVTSLWLPQKSSKRAIPCDDNGNDDRNDDHRNKPAPYRRLLSR